MHCSKMSDMFRSHQSRGPTGYKDGNCHKIPIHHFCPENRMDPDQWSYGLASNDDDDDDDDESPDHIDLIIKFLIAPSALIPSLSIQT